MIDAPFRLRNVVMRAKVPGRHRPSKAYLPLSKKLKVFDTTRIAPAFYQRNRGYRMCLNEAQAYLRPQTIISRLCPVGVSAVFDITFLVINSLEKDFATMSVTDGIGQTPCSFDFEHY